MDHNKCFSTSTCHLSPVATKPASSSFLACAPSSALRRVGRHSQRGAAARMCICYLVLIMSRVDAPDRYSIHHQHITLHQYTTLYYATQHSTHNTSHHSPSSILHFPLPTARPRTDHHRHHLRVYTKRYYPALHCTAPHCLHA